MSFVSAGSFTHGKPSQADPLKILLAKYIPDPDRRPQRDSSGDYNQSDVPTLIVSKRLRVISEVLIGLGNQ